MLWLLLPSSADSYCSYYLLQLCFFNAINTYCLFCVSFLTFAATTCFFVVWQLQFSLFILRLSILDESSQPYGGLEDLSSFVVVASAFVPPLFLSENIRQLPLSSSLFAVTRAEMRQQYRRILSCTIGS